MAEHLPLNALRAFEAAARHLSISKAAEELFVTPAAVSQQIKLLEDHIGKPVFHRLTRALALTEAGEAGLAPIQEGLSNLSEAMRLMRQDSDRNSLTVWTAPTFASKWLMPRLPDFLEKHPGIEMRLSADANLIDQVSAKGTISADDLRLNNVDIAIRFGRGSYPGCRVDKLFKEQERAVPLCSPKLLEGEHPLQTPEDLKYHVLLHDDTRYEGRPSWSDWLTEFHIDGVDPKRGLHFSQATLALDAAAEGQGVLLTMEPLAAADLQAGKLIIPFNLSTLMSRAYYVISLESRARQKNVVAFRNWILAKANQP